MMDRDKIAKKLIALRGSKSRGEVARALNVSPSALQMYESSQRIPRDAIKIKLAELYGVTVQYIFFDNEKHETCCNKKII